MGLSEWEYSMCEAIYDSASVGTELLAEKGALPYRHVAPVPDYFAEMETIGATGRVLFPKDGAASMSDGGQVATSTLSTACRRDRVAIKTSHRVQKVILNDKGEVIGVEAQNDDGVIRVKARKAVLFATGGFTHDVELRKNFLSIPVYGGCAAMTNEGDFIRISSKLGVQLRNMNYAWMCPVSFEKAIAKDPSLIGCFSVAGDSMIFVDKRGKRVVNEKLHYNELAQKFFEWDGANAAISLSDSDFDLGSALAGAFGEPRVRTADRSAGTRRQARDQRCHAWKNWPRTSMRGCRSTPARTAACAPPRISPTTSRPASRASTKWPRAGKDLDFHRGERGVDLLFNGNVKEEPGRKNADHVADERYRSVLRGAGHGRNTRHQRRTEDESRKARCWTWRTSRSQASTESATA